MLGALASSHYYLIKAGSFSFTRSLGVLLLGDIVKDEPKKVQHGLVLQRQHKVEDKKGSYGQILAKAIDSNLPGAWRASRIAVYR